MRVFKSLEAAAALLNREELGVVYEETRRAFVYRDDANGVIVLGETPTGASATFTTADSKTVTVTNGIITSVV